MMREKILSYRTMIFLALLAGAGTGIFLSGYVLVDFFPPTSRRLMLISAAAALASAAGYLLLFAWIAPRWRALLRRTRGKFIAGSLLLGAFLFFAGTSLWLKPARYVSFWLPEHQVDIRALEGKAGAVSLSWFTTSVGDVSFDDLEMRGWERRGDEVVLVDLQDNLLRWHGRTGERVQLLFSAKGGGKVASRGIAMRRNPFLFPRRSRRIGELSRFRFMRRLRSSFCLDGESSRF